MKQAGPQNTAGEQLKWCSHIGQQSLAVPQKVKKRVTFNQQFQLL